MDRIAISGCGSSRRTVLARHLGMSVTNLDALYYDEAWNPTPPEKFAVLQHELVAADRWTIEGNHASIPSIRVARADTLIFLDLSARTCLWGIAQRWLRYRGGQHADDVYNRITWSFIKYTLGYRHSMRPRVTPLLHEYGNRANLVRLTNRRQANRILQQLPATT
ncbi:topology modulation protein [Actinoplanes sp. NPDC049316]|uniref:topology modulation protein n=1 Tax=Actinoplanes sp. NPDC049316 TaxID=3154727 RepID=UPI00343F4215